MNRNQFMPYGLLTLLSTFIFIFMFFITSLLWLDVHNTKTQISVSFQNLVSHYTFENSITRSIYTIESDLYQASTKNQSFETWLNAYNQFQLTYNALNHTLAFTQNYENQSVSILLSIDEDSLKILSILEKQYRNGIDQNYSQNGDPVYGGTP
jgi:hypothetical protein